MPLTRLDPIPGDCGDEYRRAPFLTATGDVGGRFSDQPSTVRDETGP